MTPGNRAFARTMAGWLFVGLLWAGILAVIWLDRVKPAHATDNTFQARQTRALEKIASELEKTRRCQCRK